MKIIRLALSCPLIETSLSCHVVSSKGSELSYSFLNNALYGIIA